jgi:hypothetical protein
MLHLYWQTLTKTGRESGKCRKCPFGGMFRARAPARLVGLIRKFILPLKEQLFDDTMLSKLHRKNVLGS